jgi:hypothetical protein
MEELSKGEWKWEMGKGSGIKYGADKSANFCINTEIIPEAG